MSTGTVVLIDDSEAIRKTLAAALQNEGYQVVIAATGEAGLRVVLNQPPAALITDYELPGINGMAVIHRVRSNPALQQLPCILLTGADAAPPEVRGLEGGADAYLRKTAPIDVILARLGALIRNTNLTGAIAPVRQRAPESPRVLALVIEPASPEVRALLAGLRNEGLEVIENPSFEVPADLGSIECVLLVEDRDTPAHVERIRGSSRTGHAPVLVLAPRDDHAAAIQALQAGADDWVPVSSGFEVVAGRIRAHLRRRQAEQQQSLLREQALRRELADAEARAQRNLAETRAKLLAELATKNSELEQANTHLAASLREVKVRDEQFRAVARCVPGVVYLMQHDPRRTALFISVAVEGLTGRRAPDFVSGGVSWIDLVHPEERDRVFARIDSAIAQRKPFEVTYRLQHASGDWRWVEERGRAIFDEDDVRCVGGTVFDVTERLEAEEELTRFRDRQRVPTPRP